MLASSVRKLIAPVLRECPQECGIVSITDVEISSDLSYVTISVSALRNPEVALAFLETKKRELQHLLGQLQTHKTPKLRFRIDRRSEEGSKLEKLLERASQNSLGDAQ